MTIDEYIAEQPDVLEAVLADVPGQIAALRPLRPACPVYLVGSGTSRNALTAMEALLARTVPAGVRVRGPLAFLAETEATRRRKGFGIFLSQTGASANTVEAVARARALGWRALALTAERRSPIAQAAEETVVVPVGPEQAEPKTKGYTASVLTLLLLARAMGAEGTMPPAFAAELSSLIAYARGVAAELAEACEGADCFMILGQERHYATALEASLKISEMTGSAASAFDTEEAFHGRFHGLGMFSVALFVAAAAGQYAAAASAAAVLSDLGVRSRILNLASCLPGPHDLALPWPATDAFPELDLCSAIVPFQLLACELARRKGLRPERTRYPDLPRRLRLAMERAE